jgi:prepilin-type N-terminal cleavage/methylation domain-containing protein
MQPIRSSDHRGFTLLETVIAIGVLAVLLTGFMVVFTPAVQGIKKSLNFQEAERLASTLEAELVSGRSTKAPNTPFDTALNRIKECTEPDNAIFVYQYRGSLSSLRSDQTREPMVSIKGKVVGKDYVVVPMMRRVTESEFLKDLAALEGSLYLVKCKQLYFKGGELVMDDRSGDASGKKELLDPKTGLEWKNSASFPEAVIPFAAEFYFVPTNAPSYFSVSKGKATAAFTAKFKALKTPVFTLNLAVRR